MDITNNKSESLWRKGEPWVWMTGASLALTLLITATLIVVVMVNGLGVFWPANLQQLQMKDGTRVMGEHIKQEPMPSGEGDRAQFKIGNREINGLDFRWINLPDVTETTEPKDAVAIEREEYGNFYGYLTGVRAPGLEGTEDQDVLDLFHQKKEVVENLEHRIEALADRIQVLSKQMQELRLEDQRLVYNGVKDEDPELLDVRRMHNALREDFTILLNQQDELRAEQARYRLLLEDANGIKIDLPLSHVVRLYQPNDMGTGSKMLFYGSKLIELFLGEPREANTEGGLFPAIFGTVMLIFLMSLVSFPMGVIAAVYLREYAKDGPVVRLVRIAVNNLAGIPSIVYGIFGLGFFVYGIGGTLDQIFYPERLPTPTMGTGGILWASLTLAILTVPVVIVSTDEALGAIPQGVREGSLALGSTKFQLLTRILLPMASPGIMTGLILSMARAAGEVAPLMITGVVKLAPSLPLDGEFPFLHLDRKFMHLGFHIYDIGFQSPNVEAAKPMVYVTTLLLVLIVLVMSSVAIHMRNKMKKKYSSGTF